MKLTDSELWRRIENMNWIGHNFDYKKISAYLHQYNQDVCITELYAFAQKKVNDLKNTYIAFHTQSMITLTDDTLYDICWHIVGLGELEYNKSINHPVSITDYVSIYKESFAYCFQRNAAVWPPPANVPEVDLKPKIERCWCCNAPVEPPTQQEMMSAFTKLYNQESKELLIKELQEILSDLPEEILETYYINRFIKKV